MASSTRALAASLQRVAKRLHNKLTGDETPKSEEEDARSVAEDLEDYDADTNDLASSTGSDTGTRHSPDTIRLELGRVEGFIRRADALGSDDSKLRALLQALNFVSERGQRGQGAGKLVIFTESLVTQDYLRDRLVESRLISESEITLFRGTNKSKRVDEALARWREEVPQNEGTVPSPDIAARLALVHEFKTRSRVFISTEGGAKGLNLQFCDTLVNYDLPWNPQRIEQRIGRCHRYGQQHDVTVINFLARDNEAQWLTYEILSQKLELFGTVLDASDQVLHRVDGPGGEVLASALGAEFEAELRRIYERARTLEEVTTELRALREKVSAERVRFEETHTRTAGLIEERFDEGVRRVFKQHKERVPAALAEFDRDLVSVVLSYLDTKSFAHKRQALPAFDLLVVAPAAGLPDGLRDGIKAAIGTSSEHTSLSLNHPLVAAAVAAARAPGPAMSATVALTGDATKLLAVHRGKRGRLRVVKVSFNGFERVEVLVPVTVMEDGETLAPALGEALLKSHLRDSSETATTSVTDDALEDATEEILFSTQTVVDEAEQRRFDVAQRQAERFIEDRLLVLKKRRRKFADRLESAHTRRDGASSSEARTEAEQAALTAQLALEEVNAAIERLEQRDDSRFRVFQDHIHQRRYSPPQVEKLFDLSLVIE